MIIVVSIFLVSWIISVFSSVSQQERMIEKLKLLKLSSYLDFLKGFSREALLLSSHAAIQRVASTGGEINELNEPKNWICGEDVSPELDDVKYVLSEETKKYLNQYLEKLKIKDLPSINLTNFTFVDYDVNLESVSGGKNDEKFNVSGYGSEINITLEGNSVASENDVYEEIAQVRFWYMYRIFKEWAATTALSSCVQNCCGDICSDFKSCAESCINIGLRELQNLFDENVECTSSLKCCYTESGECNNALQECMECTTGQIEARAAIEAQFSCKDRKYLLSVEGDRHLVFSVSTSIWVESKRI
jgi:hypothetical protein